MAERFLSDEGKDALLEWLFCCWPAALEDQAFVRGLFFITDQEVRFALLEERERQYRKLLNYRSKN